MASVPRDTDYEKTLEIVYFIGVFSIRILGLVDRSVQLFRESESEYPLYSGWLDPEAYGLSKSKCTNSIAVIVISQGMFSSGIFSLRVITFYPASSACSVFSCWKQSDECVLIGYLGALVWR